MTGMAKDVLSDTLQNHKMSVKTMMAEWVRKKETESRQSNGHTDYHEQIGKNASLSSSFPSMSNRDHPQNHHGIELESPPAIAPQEDLCGIQGCVCETEGLHIHQQEPKLPQG